MLWCVKGIIVENNSDIWYEFFDYMLSKYDLKEIIEWGEREWPGLWEFFHIFDEPENKRIKWGFIGKQKRIWWIFQTSYQKRIMSYIKPELPCNKGEITFRAFGYELVIGWQK